MKETKRARKMCSKKKAEPVSPFCNMQRNKKKTFFSFFIVLYCPAVLELKTKVGVAA
jgi:hypothetical protein